MLRSGLTHCAFGPCCRKRIQPILAGLGHRPDMPVGQPRPQDICNSPDRWCRRWRPWHWRTTRSRTPCTPVFAGCPGSCPCRRVCIHQARQMKLTLDHKQSGQRGLHSPLICSHHTPLGRACRTLLHRPGQRMYPLRTGCSWPIPLVQTTHRGTHPDRSDRHWWQIQPLPAHTCLLLARQSSQGHMECKLCTCSGRPGLLGNRCIPCHSCWGRSHPCTPGSW